MRGTISHHKASGWTNFGKVNETIRLVDKARSKGVDIIIDLYPWRFGGTTKSLGSRFADFLSEDKQCISPREELLEKLIDASEWDKLKSAVLDAVEKAKIGSGAVFLIYPLSAFELIVPRGSDKIIAC